MLHLSSGVGTGSMASHKPKNILRQEKLSVDRIKAMPHLRAWERSGNTDELETFVKLVGDGGTFDGDFLVIPVLFGERETMKPYCVGCRTRKPEREFIDGKHRHFTCADCRTQPRRPWTRKLEAMDSRKQHKGKAISLKTA
jgi:hypothetical protein